MEHINWYPGHMKKTRELIAANLKLVDAVVEVCDARIPVSSENPIIDALVGDKRRVRVLNKSDLADERATKAWLEHYRRGAGADLRAVLALNSLHAQSAHILLKKLETMEDGMNRKRGRDAPVRRRADRSAGKSADGLRLSNCYRGNALRVMVVGIPNVGKSSLINRLVGRKSAATGDRPGVTRGKQWLTLLNGMQLLDTPGILWPKFEDPDVGLHLAFCGSIRDEIMDVADLGLELIRLLAREYPDMLAARFRLDLSDLREAGMSGDADARNACAGRDGASDGSADFALGIMERIAIRRGFVLSGGRIDYNRAANAVLDEFRSCKIGRITLERPPA
ncbi:MAG: ribosome biogenesis GTPase YlqF [Clostridiales Family XIII bacterium]|jgi:ribosome biogenesis GTPase A|nr:ribosome biogenesis GTPase YlqF [Clostridiales Family XIII bacterium]